MECFVCLTCGTQFAPSEEPPAGCPICLDERQYVGRGGQRWTTLAELGPEYRSDVRELEPGLVGIGIEPEFAIGQRAIHVEGGVLWDYVTVLDEAAAEAVERAGGIHTIAISHPHYYSAMVEWADLFDARILLHEADREWVMRPSERIEHWSGERTQASDEVELIHLGGHFAGGTVALWNGALLSGDVVSIVADRDWASFMWSYPNLIPLPAREVERIRGVVETLDFDRVYGAFWGSVMRGDGRAKVLRSADRYIAAVRG